MSSDEAEPRLQILVVDDEPGISSFLREFLISAGYEVRLASDGAQALELAEGSFFHIALVDLTLPDMNGLDVVKGLKQRIPDVVVVIMSGMTLGSYDELYKYGAEEYLAKPFSLDELSFMIRKHEKYIRALIQNRRLRDDLENQQEKGRFFSEAGHQLKTPIAVLKEFTHLFREGFGGELSEKQQQYMECIDQNIDRLLYLVENIEQLSRVDSGRWTIRLRAEDPAKIIGGVVDSWQPILERRNLRLVHEVPDDLPRVQADTAAVEQVLFNLIDNASKYGPAGGTVTLRGYRANEGFVCLEVEDQGPGIPEDQRELLFQPFTRLPEHESAPGLGLGLTVAQSLMRQLGGDLVLDSGSQPGNRFYLRLPVASTSS